ncbi:antiviral reverse transcriptase Drt3b [Prosthecobacter vanneervenii]|uniref:Reverse transcriptase domain-containing protein n=1 Tax=Prosthecobacter vanneervenii TaxID=48466 RepID=A0A7W8DKW3_9BACT|nr:antiviral reverse transcriptase Drt3b [Prosthecobacter vanneervenii]MBB5033440.1 hypothetical protein [Prosthecobacter vanneervenii]
MKRPIQQSDSKRAILTDLIPYEVPLRFSFHHLHRAILEPSSPSSGIKKLLAKKIDSCIPYSYWIRTGEGRKRMLGLIHPLLLEDAAILYSDYGDLIVSLCSKSKWSLRRPCRIAKMYFGHEQNTNSGVGHNLTAYQPNSGTPSIGLNGEVENQLQKHASSFFVYEPHNLLQKFYTSKDLLALERKFFACRRIDISKCFGSIYTHSISWAIKGKAAAKMEKSCAHTFDAKFDAIMRRSNHGETHGILIGAELSRIFAEIIFQEIDSRAKRQLSADCMPDKINTTGCNIKLVDGVDYSVRRYIDDYFIFANEVRVLDHIQEVIEDHLEYFKLYVNEKKTSTSRRPFITGISTAKVRISQLITSLLDFNAVSSLSEKSDLTQSNHHFSSVKVINGVRQIIGEVRVEYPDISSSALKIIHNLVCKKIGFFRLEKPGNVLAGQWIRCVVEVAFYLFSVDVRFRTSILISRILSDIAKSCEWLPSVDSKEIEDAIVRESIVILKHANLNHGDNHLEISNFLIALSSIKEYWRVPERLVLPLCMVGVNTKRRPEYFTIIAIIFFASDRAEYKGLQVMAFDVAQQLIAGAASILEDTEMFCLSLDMLSCPWAEVSFKLNIGKKIYAELKLPAPTRADLNSFVHEFSSQTWFFDWDRTVDNLVYLQKKELCLGY